jgi:hypothetical protein
MRALFRIILESTLMCRKMNGVGSLTNIVGKDKL